jgi:hypothetical protein
MKLSALIPVCLAITLATAGSFSLAARNSQSPDSQSQARQPKPEAANRITISVSGGEKDVPVENASIYLKYVEEHKIKKDKTIELNVKTNREGTAHVPDAPLGRALIQVIAQGWKTYGQWYDITDTKQSIKIHLERPPKWY